MDTLSNDEMPVPIYFSRRNGVTCAGVSLGVDIWGATGLNDVSKMRAVLIECVSVCGAKMRNIDLFQFGGAGGVAGVAILMQSHLSVHTWPEHGYAAFDAFMCGDADPYKMIPLLKQAFSPKQIQLTEHVRGLMCP